MSAELFTIAVASAILKATVVFALLLRRRWFVRAAAVEVVAPRSSKDLADATSSVGSTGSGRAPR